MLHCVTPSQRRRRGTSHQVFGRPQSSGVIKASCARSLGALRQPRDDLSQLDPKSAKVASIFSLLFDFIAGRWGRQHWRSGGRRASASGSRPSGGRSGSNLGGPLFLGSRRGRRTWMSSTILFRHQSQREGRENAGDRSLFFGCKDKNLTANPLLLFHQARFGRTRRQRYLPRTCLL